jgi:hypothetical protein
MPIKRVSTSRAGQLREYTKVKREFLRTHKHCFVCGNLGHDLHHLAGRSGKLLTWVPMFRCACRACHDWIHRNPLEAFAKGYMSKGMWNDFDRAVKHNQNIEV